LWGERGDILEYLLQAGDHSAKMVIVS
jgi:hypothetical protein